MENTGAIGITSKAGRYGGTYAHKDIAFEFASWVSVEFKLYLIKEFQRLKEEEKQTLGWDIKRNLARINYRIYVDDPGAYNPALLGRRATLPESPTFRRISFIDSGRGEASWARAYSVSANGKYFNGRLQSMLGTRLDTAIALESTPRKVTAELRTAWRTSRCTGLPSACSTSIFVSIGEPR